MSNKRNIYISVCIFLLILVTYQIGYGEGNPPADQTPKDKMDVTHSTFQFKGNDFTQPEPASAENLPILAIPDAYEKVEESKELELYVQKDTMNIMVRDKRSGYVWSSVPDKSIQKETQLNESWSQRSIHRWSCNISMKKRCWSREALCR